MYTITNKWKIIAQNKGIFSAICVSVQPPWDAAAGRVGGTWYSPQAQNSGRDTREIKENGRHRLV